MMARWDWLIKPEQPYSWRFVRNVVLKAIVIFCLLNLLYAVLNPLGLISRLTVYNTLVPGRERLPYSDNPSEAYNLSLSTLDGMFASHVISDDEKNADEYRVVLIGDSSVWGVLLNNEETLSACINQSELSTADGKRIQVYNLGYPVLSVFKDALILDEALEHDVDAVIWLTTLQAFFDLEQLRHPIVSNNADAARGFVNQYELALNASTLPDRSLWDRTLIAQRRELAEWLRFQIYGLAWWMTEDDYAPGDYLGAPVLNLPESDRILNRSDIEVASLNEQGVLAWDVLHTGMSIAAEQGVPILLVNEPIFISDGLNSDLRYNEYYPRWAYDEYRTTLANMATDNQWPYLDLWDVVPLDRFTDTSFHYEPSSVCAVAEMIILSLLEITAE